MHSGLFRLLISLIPIFLVGCSIKKSSQPSVIVIAVEQLGADDIQCGSEHKNNEKSGIDILCANSIRFTHAYTTSLQSRAAVASVLTGLTPFDHHVHDNNFSFLSTQIKSVAKSAFKAGYSTSLFTGGPLILRNSGFQQGFDFIEDNLQLGLKKYFRPLKEMVPNILSWQNSQNKPTFSFIYAPDLLFKNRATFNELGEAQNLSYESQLVEFDKSLYALLNPMKSKNELDKTLIILVGLNARNPDPEGGLINGANLHSRHTQVTLLIKPPRKPRDEGLAWSFDANVSIADVGASLFDFLDDSAPKSEIFPSFSLLPVFDNKEVSGLLNRWVFSESSWFHTNDLGSMIYSIRKNQFHIIHNGKLNTFNTLIDKMENSPLQPRDFSISEIRQESNKIISLLEKNDPIKIDRDSLKSQYIFNFDLWSTLNPKPELLTNLQNAISAKEKFPVAKWLFYELIQSGKWQDLLRLRDQIKNSDFLMVAERNLGAKHLHFQSPCLEVLDLQKWDSNSVSQCQDKRVLNLIDFVRSDQDKSLSIAGRENLRKTLTANWRSYNYLYQAHKLNLSFGLIWNQPETELQDWERYMLAINMPVMQRVKSLLAKDL